MSFKWNTRDKKPPPNSTPCSRGFSKYNTQKPYNGAKISSLISKKMDCIIALTNGKFVGPLKLKLLKYGYEEKLEIKILPPTNNVSFKNAWLCGIF
jgi:hypothetical protein